MARLSAAAAGNAYTANGGSPHTSWCLPGNNWQALAISARRQPASRQNTAGVAIPDKAMFRIDEVAAICSVHPDTVRRWTKEGKLAALYLPLGRIRVARADLEALLKADPEGNDS